MNLAMNTDNDGVCKNILKDWSSSYKPKIIKEHPGITTAMFIELYKSGICKINENLNNSGIYEIYNDLLKYKPMTFEDILIYYKTVCSLSLISEGYFNTITFAQKINLLHKAFTIDISNWDDNPITLHLICKSLLEILKCSKNLVFFSKTICPISRTSNYISICLMWTGLYKLLKIKKDMHRFHEFSNLIQLVENFEISKAKTDKNCLYIILEIVSFLQTTVILKSSIIAAISKTNNVFFGYYGKCFKYSHDDILRLKNWCEKVKREYTLNPIGGGGADYALINEIIEFDILYMMQDMFYKKTLDE